MRGDVLLGCALCLTAAGCGDASDLPDAPVATLALATTTLAGEVDVDYTVSDPQSRLVNVAFRWGTGPAPLNAATPATGSAGTQGLFTSPQGNSYRYRWDTVADVGYQRLESIYLGVVVLAGAVDGIGDERGPLVIDNTGLPRVFRVQGDICRAASMLGTQAGDFNGKLYLGLYSDLAYPPTAQSVESIDLGSQDFSNASTCVPYAFTGVSPGNYQLIAVLDDNNNNLTSGGFSIDAGDATNLGGTAVQVVSADVSQAVVLNYFCTGCP